MNQRPREAENHECKHHGDQKQHHGIGACRSHLGEAERILEQIQHIQEARIIRSSHGRRSAAGIAAGHNRRLDEGLEGIDEAHDGVKEDDGRAHRNGDVDELMPSIPSVHLQRFVQMGGNSLQACQEDDNRTAAIPQAEQYQGRDDSGVRGQPCGCRQSRCIQQVIDNAEIRLKHPHPDDPGGSKRNDYRKIEYTSEESPGLNPLIKQNGQGEGKHDAYRNADKHIIGRSLHSREEENVSSGEHILVVIHADKLDGPADGIIRKAQYEGYDQGNQDEDGISQQYGRRK